MGISQESQAAPEKEKRLGSEGPVSQKRIPQSSATHQATLQDAAEATGCLPVQIPAFNSSLNLRPQVQYQSSHRINSEDHGTSRNIRSQNIPRNTAGFRQMQGSLGLLFFFFLTPSLSGDFSFEMTKVRLLVEALKNKTKQNGFS